MKERILVTGGTGYIGSHTVVELQNSGYEVIIIDNLSNSSADVVDNIEKVSGIRPAFEKLDCLDFAGLDAVFAKYKGIKAIIHFAASKAVGESVEKPLLYYRNNLVSLINLLELMPKHGVEGIVFSSSCTVYGQPDELPVTEKAPIKKAESPYGNTKQINEEIIRDTIASGAPINAILLRYFNPIGAHPTALLGELPNGVPQNLIPYLTQTAMGIREKLSVFGDDYDTPDGSCIRDFINVVDLAKAHVIAIRRILEQKQKEKVEVFNIGTGRGVSVLELINGFEKATGVKLNYQIVGRRAGVFYLPRANGLVSDGNGGYTYDIADLNGGGVSLEDGDDRYVAGQAVPKTILGSNLSFRYKRFDISVQINGAFGHKIYNGTSLTYMNMNIFPDYNVMQEAPARNIKDQTATDYWLENGAYVNFDYVTLGWNVPIEKVQKLKKYVRSLRLAFTVNNLATISGYSGLSPMINSSTVNSTLGLDDKRGYPLARTYTLGLSINF